MAEHPCFQLFKGVAALTQPVTAVAVEQIIPKAQNARKGERPRREVETAGLRGAN